MKKFLCALIATLFLLTAAAMPTLADDEVTGQTDAPDWIITEISPDQQGMDGNTNGYTSDVTADCFEFIEIYNNSGRELDLYDYAVIYNGSARDSAKFEHQITEYTPIKPGDYLDGSNLIPTEEILPFGDLSNKPVNPDTCKVAPGEVVVLWMVYLEAYQGRFNDGKGMSEADFRAHWNIPEDVKVIAVDANGNVKNGGHDKNFNVKNSKVGTYGIAHQSVDLEAACNVVDSPAVDGNYWESEHLVCWATVDFTDMLLDGSMANVTYNFTWDFSGYAAIDQAYTYYNDADYVYDARRCYLLTQYAEPSVGLLTPLQKMTLNVELAEGESFTFDPYTIYYPLLDEKIEGYKVNGKFYEDNSTFTAPAAGLYTYNFFFEGEEITEAPTEAPTDAETAEPTDEATEAVTDPKTDTATEAPTNPTTDPSTDAPADTDAPAQGGCGAVLSSALLSVLVMGAVLTCKKRKD